MSSVASVTMLVRLMLLALSKNPDPKDPALVIPRGDFVAKLQALVIPAKAGIQRIFDDKNLLNDGRKKYLSVLP